MDTAIDERGRVETWLDDWFISWHGDGEKQQSLVYRCQGCRRLITHKTIAKGPCRCGINRVYSTNPTPFEKFRLYVLPWTITPRK